VAEKSGGIVSEGRKVLMTAETAGDEPYMMALRLKSIQVPVIVGQDRYSAGRLALNRFDPEVIVLDDAFQHAKLARDIDLVLLDHNKPLGNGHLLPRGVLREPAAVLSRADAIIVTRTDHQSGPGAAALPAQVQPMVQHKPVFRTAHVPYVSNIVKNSPGEGIDGAFQTDANYLHGRNVFAFSGIARNEDFEQTLGQLGCVVVGFVGFSDHHRYTDEDIRLIMNAAADTGAVCLLTTEKDYVRIVNRLPLSLPLVVIGIRLRFLGDATAFDGFIADRLAHCA
jgi:tetraacyldisaccharide 4'-kinase